MPFSVSTSTVDVVLRQPGQSTGAKRELRAFELLMTSSMGRPLILIRYSSAGTSGLPNNLFLGRYKRTAGAVAQLSRRARFGGPWLDWALSPP